MNKTIINFVVTLVLAIVLSQFLPWWSIMVAAFISSFFFSLKKGAVFFVPFLAIGLLWSIHAFWLSTINDFILAKKIATLLSLAENAMLLIVITGLIGGIAAGVAAVFGKQCASLVNKTS